MKAKIKSQEKKEVALSVGQEKKKAALLAVLEEDLDCAPEKDIPAEEKKLTTIKIERILKGYLEEYGFADRVSEASATLLDCEDTFNPSIYYCILTIVVVNHNVISAPFSSKFVNDGKKLWQMLQYISARIDVKIPNVISVAFNITAQHMKNTND